MSEIFTARPPTSRLSRVVAVVFVLATVAGGLIDMTWSASAAPPDHAKGQPGGGNDKCHPVRGCETGDTVDGSTDESPEEPTEESTDEPIQEPTEEPTQEPTEESTEVSTEEPTQEPTEESTTETTGLWLSAEEVASLPTSGDAWEALYKDAVGEWSSAAVADQDSRHDTQVLAGALVGVRLDHDGMKDRVREALATVPGTEEGGRTLALGRNLVAYVLAADLVGYRDSTFVTWVDEVRFTDLDGRTLVSTHEVRPNNWGTHAGASRIAAALYLGDQRELDRAADVFAGWLGDRTRYTGFEYGDLSWQCDPDRPVGVNPHGCTIDGHDVGGVLPDDQRRGGGFTWPPPAENYVWEALQGAVVQAELLDRAGLDPWSWSDRALARAIHWLHTYPDYPAEGDDTWIPWLVNHGASTSFPAPSPSQHGKNLGYTDWSHS